MIRFAPVVFFVFLSVYMLVAVGCNAAYGFRQDLINITDPHGHPYQDRYRPQSARQQNAQPYQNTAQY